MRPKRLLGFNSVVVTSTHACCTRRIVREKVAEQSIDSRAAAAIIWGLVPDRIADKPTNHHLGVSSRSHCRQAYRQADSVGRLGEGARPQPPRGPPACPVRSPRQRQPRRRRDGRAAALPDRWQCGYCPRPKARAAPGAATGFMSREFGCRSYSGNLRVLPCPALALALAAGRRP